MLREVFNKSWIFYKAGHENEAISITLPHDAMFYEKRMPNCKNAWNTGYFPGGVYIYTKKFFSPEEFRNKHVIIEFEGIYMNSEIYINDILAGGWHYGYSNFYVNADPFLKYAAENVLKVVVHNDGEPNSRWYSGSGIYRDVKLIIGNLCHIPCDGVKITTKSINQKALLDVKTTLKNLTNKPRDLEIITTVILGKEIVATSKFSSSIKPNGNLIINQDLSIEKPMLWSVEIPHLYLCQTQITENHQIIDEDLEYFGIRIIEVDAKKGFRINGIETKLRGACNHHDNGIIGAMTFEAAEERRVRILKQAGYNAIRSAHNPMSKAMLDACDKYGLLVMDETFDQWYYHKNPHDYATWFEECWEIDVEAMVAKDYNHPSVIMYSVGNEIGETATPKGIEYNRKIVEKVHNLDPIRPVINSINPQINMANFLGFGIYNTQPKKPKPGAKEKKGAIILTGSAWINGIMNFFHKISDPMMRWSVVDKATKEVFAPLDIAGYNYAEGRYELDGKLYPTRVICGSETYPPDIAKNWRLVKKLPYVIGDFQWTGWDYLGEAGIGSWQYNKRYGLYKPYPGLLADCGVIDITGLITSQAYYNQIVWGLRKSPYIGVRPVNHSKDRLSKTVWRGTDAIESWSWEGYEGCNAIVEVYSNADSVEMQLNGHSLGRQKAGDQCDYKVIFKAKYQPGELLAIAYDSEHKEVGRSVLKTAGAHLQLEVKSEVTTLKANGADLAYLNIALTDENGIVKPLADRKISIKVEGEGELLGFGSANPFTEEIFTGSVHTTYYGRALAIIRSGFKEDDMKIYISTEGCETKNIIIPIKK